MIHRHSRRRRLLLAAVTTLASWGGSAPLAWGQAQPPAVKDVALEALPTPRPVGPEPAPGILDDSIMPIDLPAALRLAGVDNPQVLIARTRVLEAVALRQFAAAQLLPTINAGSNFDSHTGVLQQSSGKILSLDRSSLYLGAGANAVAAGSVSIPGVVYNVNVSTTIFNMLMARQGVERARYNSIAVRNEAFRNVADSYVELLRAYGRRSIAKQALDEATEVARLTNVFAKAGQVAQADAERSATELNRRRTDLAEADAELSIASARLAALLAVDRAVRLQPIEENVVPTPLVPDAIPLSQLLGIALIQRPELAAYQAAVRQAMLGLDAAKLLPFSPNLIVGFSSGTMGGGSNLVASSTPPAAGLPPNQPRFGNFGQRNDLDVISYWTLQNLGFGNRAQINLARSRLSIEELEQLKTFNQVRREVAEAAIRTHTRFSQITVAENAVITGDKAFKEDFRRVQGLVGRPIELLESLRLLADSRLLYLNAISDYNVAQIDLYVALGQPPADALARPVPTNFAVPVPTVAPQNAPRPK